ncbi:MAG: DUF624 domain-containing protein [Clostridiales bacterium]|nr:DUF624 domain-containing protein [Clostridiales bacterium]
MAGFFNRMYYGDPRKPDLRPEDMPDNRFKLFFTVLRVRIWKLIQLNLLYAIFWIPSFALLYIQSTVTQQTGEPLSILFFLLLTPCLMIAGPATAGVTYVIRDWSRDEHAWLFSDFKDAWKVNWKESLLIMLINALALLIFYINVNFYRQMIVEKWGFMLLYYFILIMGFIYLMMNMFLFPMLITYKLKVRQIFKNAFIFTIAELPRNIFIFAISAGIFLLSASYILSIPAFILGMTLPMLVFISYTNWVFDKYLNKAKEDEVQN